MSLLLVVMIRNQSSWVMAVTTVSGDDDDDLHQRVPSCPAGQLSVALQLSSIPSPSPVLSCWTAVHSPSTLLHPLAQSCPVLLDSCPQPFNPRPVLSCPAGQLSTALQPSSIPSPSPVLSCRTAVCSPSTLLHPLAQSCPVLLDSCL